MFLRNVGSYYMHTVSVPGDDIPRSLAPYAMCILVSGRCVWDATFADRGVSSGQRDGSPTVVNLSFLDRSRYFSFK
jgi:hypothetical protein